MRPAAGDFLIALSSDGQLSGFKPVHVEDGKDVGCGGSSPLDRPMFVGVANPELIPLSVIVKHST